MKYYSPHERAALACFYLEQYKSSGDDKYYVAHEAMVKNLVSLVPEDIDTEYYQSVLDKCQANMIPLRKTDVLDDIIEYFNKEGSCNPDGSIFKGFCRHRETREYNYLAFLRSCESEKLGSFFYGLPDHIFTLGASKPMLESYKVLVYSDMSTEDRK